MTEKLLVLTSSELQVVFSSFLELFPMNTISIESKQLKLAFCQNERHKIVQEAKSPKPNTWVMFQINSNFWLIFRKYKIFV